MSSVPNLSRVMVPLQFSPHPSFSVSRQAQLASLSVAAFFLKLKKKEDPV